MKQFYVSWNLFRKKSTFLKIFFLFIHPNIYSRKWKAKICKGNYCCCSVLTYIQLFTTLWATAHQAPCPSPSLRVCSNSCPVSRWCHTTISSLLLPSHALSLSQHQGLFQWVRSLHQVAKELGLQLQHQSFQWILRVDFL